MVNDMDTKITIDNQEHSQADRSYDWAAYYESAYRALKEKNIQTVLEIDREQKNVSTLTEAMEFITGNRFWKVMTPVRKVCDRIDAVRHPASKPASSTLVKAYEQEIYRLKHRYQMWMREVEPDRLASFETVNEAVLEQFYFISVAEGVISSKAPAIWSRYLQENPDTVVAYGDEDFYAFISDIENTDAPEDSACHMVRMTPWLKPGWSPETFLGFFYFGSYFAIRKETVASYMDSQTFEEMMSVLSEKDREKEADVQKALIQLYHLVLQCTRKAASSQVLHIPHILFHRQFKDFTEADLESITANRNWDRVQRVEAVLQSKLEQGHYMWGHEEPFNEMKIGFLADENISAHMEAAMNPAEYHVVYDVGTPLVSAVVLSKDHPDTLELCMKSLRERTDYPNLEIIVVDNGSNETNQKAIRELKNKYKFNYLYHSMEFNFSAQCNLGVSKAQGELILLLNDDIEVFEKSWLRKMVGQAMQSGIGAVGARLLYAGTNKIQHAGITNLRVGPSHKLIACPDDVNYYFGRNRVTYDMLGVTAACLLVTRQKYQEVCGFEESMRVAYNDVDFCFKLYEKGYRNVLRNDAVLYHYESLSRGLDAQNHEKWARLLDEKKRLYDAHPDLKGIDPYDHEMLADDSSEYRILYQYPAEDKHKFAGIEKVDASKLAKARGEKAYLQVDHQELCLHEEAEKPDYYWVSGWSYLHGEDQSKYTRHLLFKNENQEIFEGMYFMEYRNDVESMLFSEINVSAAGFSTRFVKGSLKPGAYQVGMLYEDRMSNEKYLSWWEQKFEICE